MKYFDFKKHNESLLTLYKLNNVDVGTFSDGYHTFNELYHHRAILFSVICNTFPFFAWKSKKHHDGSMYDGMFIVGIETPEGQATYHYDIKPYWDMFNVNELENAPMWDGHTPDQAIERIKSLNSNEFFEMMVERMYKYLDKENMKNDENN